MGVIYLERFHYHRRPGYRINCQLVLNAAYSCCCPASIDCMHWSLKQSQTQYQRQKMQDKVTSTNIAQCNHLTVRLGPQGGTELLNWGCAPPPFGTAPKRLKVNSGVVTGLGLTCRTVACGLACDHACNDLSINACMYRMKLEVHVNDYSDSTIILELIV